MCTSILYHNSCWTNIAAVVRVSDKNQWMIQQQFLTFDWATCHVSSQCSYLSHLCDSKQKKVETLHMMRTSQHASFFTKHVLYYGENILVMHLTHQKWRRQGLVYKSWLDIQQYNMNSISAYNMNSISTQHLYTKVVY